MMNQVNYFEEGAGTIRTIECDTYCPMVAALDKSGSKNTMMSNGKTRYQNAVDELERSLLKLAENESVAENVHLYLYLFGNNEVTCVVDGIALCDIKIAELCQHLRAQRCMGNTPMGRCIVEALDKLKAAKEKARSMQVAYAQPILTLISDGIATDDMTEAKRLVAAAMDDNGQQKLLFLPLGIGEPGAQFPVFDSMLEKDKYETPVVRDAEGIRAYFRFLGKTVRAVSRGQYIVPSNHFGKVRTIAENAARMGQNGAPAPVGGDY